MDFNKRVIDRWDEGIPLGNGHIGGLLFGNDKIIRLNLDCSSLWDTRIDQRINGKNFTFSEMLSLIQKGENSNKELQEWFGNFYEGNPFPTKIPAGSLQFSCPIEERQSFFFDSKIASGGLLLSNNRVIESFFSADNFLGYVRIPKEISFSFVPPSFKKKEISDKNDLSNLGYQDGELLSEDNTIIYRQPMHDGQYSFVAKYQIVGEGVIIIFSIIPCSNSALEIKTLKTITEALKKGFDFAFEKHKKWWSDYYKKTAITLPKSSKNVLELYDFMQYLLGSGSRKGFFPMPLQGVWTSADDSLPPWKGDYHFDLNVQGTYNWAYRSGRFEEIYPLIDYFIKNNQNIINFSERFFEMKDTYFIPGAADLSGNVMGGWVQYTYSLGSSLWMVILLDKWYEFALDKNYLLETLLPILDKSFNVLINAFLIKTEQQYKLRISISPEINNNYYSAWLKNSTYDLSLIKEFLNRYKRRLNELSINCDKVDDVLNNLVNEPINENGYLLAESFPLQESHRHLSHAMNIFPLQTIDYLKDSQLIDKTIQTIDKYGTKEWVGFSFTWMSSLYACSGDGNNALRYLNQFIDGFTSPNGFNLNGDYQRKGYSNFDYRPFTLEANGMFNDAVQEMLMQYHHNILRLFPAIPDEWKKEGCSFKGFYLNKNIIISASIKNEEIICEIDNRTDKQFLTIYAFNKMDNFVINRGINVFKFKA